MISLSWVLILANLLSLSSAFRYLSKGFHAPSYILAFWPIVDGSYRFRRADPGVFVCTQILTTEEGKASLET
jgi:hypothetical protein